MFPRTRQQAWIRGLPGLEKEGGFPFETLSVSTPTPDHHSLTVTFYGSKELVSKLQSLAKQHATLPTFSLTVRTDVVKELDNQFQVTDAVIDSIAPLKDLAGAQDMTILFASISARMALTANPGPPVNCPTVDPSGVNTGWIFGLPHEDLKTGKPVEIVDFIPPHYNRRLFVTLGRPSNEIKDLLPRSVPVQELILVLPDRSRQRYVEFKLWDPKPFMQPDGTHLAFDSDMIECLTGEENRGAEINK